MKKVLSILLTLVLLASLAALPVSANESPAPEIVWDENEETILLTNGAAYGEGETSFTFVAEYNLRKTFITVNTDAATVGQALLDLNIIAGDDSDWGLYVKTVNGITADYDTDGSYWAFYINGDYALTGVDATDVEANAIYTMKVEGIEEDDTILLTDGENLGMGETFFTFITEDAEKNPVTITVNTDATTVGQALLELGVIAGDESDWGLYVKTVNGITADYDTDGSYWAFYVGDEYALTGVDATEIESGATYTFHVEK